MSSVVLVTGATGFIGRQTLPLLVEKGYEVHVISTQPSFDSFVPTAHNLPLIRHTCDLFHEEKVSRLIKEVRPSHLLHFAWITTPGVCLASPDNLKWVEISAHLIRSFAAHGGKRVVVAGSCAEYEIAPYCSENANSFQATTLYGQCKRKLYSFLESLSKEVAFEFAWGYIFYLYGPYEHPDRFLPSVIRGILHKQEIRLTEGYQIRDFLHVSDAAEGFVELLNSTVQGSFNIASGEGVSLRKIVEKVAEKIGGQELLKFGSRPLALFDPPELVADITKLKGSTAWRPTTSLDQGLDQVIAWWQHQLGAS